ncbi:hypothetical protein PSE_3625 [Pseudovibrio sp. FO-BEG1]|nr:hypothetical protein PSE_3625 [Pseudovibrio sp. FO-BEG1]
MSIDAVEPIDCFARFWASLSGSRVAGKRGNVSCSKQVTPISSFY